jgi:hypothetical protein
MCIVATDGNITCFNIPMPETTPKQYSEFVSTRQKTQCVPIQKLVNISFIMAIQTKGKEKYLPAFTLYFPFQKIIVLNNSASFSNSGYGRTLHGRSVASVIRTSKSASPILPLQNLEPQISAS